MDFQIGDKVVHWSYGPGEVIQVDEKNLGGRTAIYYVVQVRDLTLWVPVDQGEKHSLRLPTSADQFEALFGILRGLGEVLAEDRYERKSQLTERLRDGKLESVCRVIRDLCFYNSKKKLNDNDAMILERARKFLLDEWKIAFRISSVDAQRELDRLLDEGRQKAIQ